MDKSNGSSGANGKISISRTGLISLVAPIRFRSTLNFVFFGG